MNPLNDQSCGRVRALALLGLMLAGCGGGGGAGTPPITPPITPPPTPPVTSPAPAPSTPPTPAAPMTAAYAEGTRLQYLSSTINSSASSSGTSRRENVALLTVTLGAARFIEGRRLHPVQVQRWTPEAGIEDDVSALRWKFVGSADGGLQGSLDGATVQTLYGPGAQTVRGWLQRFDPAVPPTAQPRVQQGRYATLSGIGLAYSKSGGGCQVVNNMTFCQDQSSRFSQLELFRNGIGSIGSRVETGLSSIGGGVATVSSSVGTVELVASTLAPADGGPLPDFRSSPGSTLPNGRPGAAASLVDGRVHVFGAGTTGASAGVIALDAATGRWNQTAGLALQDQRLRGATQPDLQPINLAGFRALDAGFGSILLVRAGAPVHRYRLGEGWVYDGPGYYTLAHGGDKAPAGTVWDAAVWARSDGTRQALLMVSTSATAGAHGFDIYRYSIAQNSWSRLLSLTSPTAAPRLAVVGDRLVLTLENRGIVTCTLPGGPCVQTPNVLATARSGAQLAVLGDRVLVFGGRDTEGQVLADVESLDPASRSSRALPPLMAARSGFAALPEGARVHLIGGSFDGRDARGVEIYTP